MNVSDTKAKPKKGAVQQKKPEKDADELRKIVSLVYPAFAMFLKACESERARKKPLAKMARGELPAHLDRAIIQAETYPERDLLCRRLASQCYKFSKMFMKNCDYKQAVKWMNMALRFLRLSMDPKKESVAEKFMVELTALEKKLEELKHQEVATA
jgi:hypothetical protein